MEDPNQPKKVRNLNKKTKKTTSFKEKDLILPVFNFKGEVDKNISLPKEIFSIKINEKLLAHYVYIYLANQRKKTASTKMRGEVIGSTRKIYRQKGTGRARHGDIRAPIFVGGGVVGGPKPYKRILRMNKKQKKLVLFSSLSLKFKNDDIVIFSSELFKIKPKTKIAYDFLKKINLLDKKLLFILPNFDNNSFILASRNLPNVNFIDIKTLNPYLILKSQKIIFFEEAISILKNHYLKIGKNNQ